MRYRMRTRRFLNQLGFNGGAYIIAEVGDTSTAKRPGATLFGSQVRLTIADCTRVIDLDFSLIDAKERRNSLRKVDIMLDVLTRFRAALAEEAELAKRRQREPAPEDTLLP